ncbi:uncharacterized protein LOC105692937 [Athalia rosae]|uniref:uncharacterized protein LOC105692937 n=1 Tax=Athalia rosae TaxID=37344 RepID=UPI0020337369|nr:uncharacterized protein LOC105692937 [Athalia rosae]
MVQSLHGKYIRDYLKKQRIVQYYQLEMLIVNEGFCNSTRLIAIELRNHFPECEILTSDNAREIVFLNRITLYCDDIHLFTFKRRQFLIKLAFAMTINKYQGQPLEKIGIDLRKDVSNHGQLYVVRSRVRSKNSLKIFLSNQKTDRKVIVSSNRHI